MNIFVETLKRKWVEYLLEILVIIIGILGAFALNNWNESRKSKQTEFVLLTELHKSVKNEIEHLTTVIERNQSYIASGEISLKAIEEKQIINDTVASHLQRAFKVWHINMKASAYHNLSDYGLHLIKDEETRNGILSVYDGNVNFVGLVYERYDQFLYNVIEPELKERFEFKKVLDDDYGLFPLDNYEDSSHHRLKYLLRRSMDLQNQIIRAEERALRAFKKLGEALKIEMKDHGGELLLKNEDENDENSKE